MNEQNCDYQEELVASIIGTTKEEFTPRYSVLSLSLGFLVAAEEHVLSLQREFGEEAEDSGDICVVLSPSQKCAYNPLKKLVLCRSSLGMQFTEEAAKVFGVTSLRLGFSVPDAAYNEFQTELGVLCEGQSYFVYEVKKPKLTLAQSLELFDPTRHSGEVLAVKPIGAEILNDSKKGI